jgi:hypothetical protein
MKKYTTMLEDWQAAQAEKLHNDLYEDEPLNGFGGTKSYIGKEQQNILDELDPTSEFYKPVPIGETYNNLIGIMKRIWKSAIGLDYVVTNNEIPAFTRKYWHVTLAERARTRYLEKIWTRQAEKLCAEAKCRRHNTMCFQQCPTKSPLVCPDLKIPRSISNVICHHK